MPSEPAPITFTIRLPGRAPFRAVSLDDLTNILRIKRELRMTIRDELKAKRLKAMGVVSAQTAATGDMYDRIVEAGTLVDKARTVAEAAHMSALNEHLAILREDAEELLEFAQAVPTNGGSDVSKPAKPAVTPAQQLTGAAALAALEASQPNPKPAGWADGDAYTGTRSAP